MIQFLFFLTLADFRLPPIETFTSIEKRKYKFIQIHKNLTDSTNPNIFKVYQVLQREFVFLLQQ